MCVQAESGIEASEKFRARIPRHGGTAVHVEKLRALLAGEAVEVEASQVAGWPDADRGLLTIVVRFARDAYRTRVLVRPMTGDEVSERCPGEAALGPAVVDDWWTPIGADGARWRLFRCVVVNLYSDPLR